MFILAIQVGVAAGRQACGARGCESPDQHACDKHRSRRSRNFSVTDSQRYLEGQEGRLRDQCLDQRHLPGYDEKDRAM
jgi:hypothetical protein